MIRISTIFIAICMVLVAASLGLILYSVAGISGTESAIVALTALTFLILYNAVSMRLRDREDVGSQIADLSRGTADLARQVAEFGRRLAAVEGRVASANSANADRVQAVAGEIGELGTLVKQLAASVAGHDDMLSAGEPAAAVARGDDEQSPLSKQLAASVAGHDDMLSAGVAAAAVAAAGGKPDNEPQKELPFAAEDAARALPTAVAGDATPSRSPAQILAAVKNAVEENRIDIFLQPMVTLPQRKGRYY